MTKWAIYRIRSRLESIHDTYIGCSADYYKRKKEHIRNSRKVNNAQFVHYFINNNGGNSMWYFEIIDNCKKIKTKAELFKLETEYINSSL